MESEGERRDRHMHERVWVPYSTPGRHSVRNAGRHSETQSVALNTSASSCDRSPDRTSPMSSASGASRPPDEGRRVKLIKDGRATPGEGTERDALGRRAPPRPPDRARGVNMG